VTTGNGNKKLRVTLDDPVEGGFPTPASLIQVEMIKSQLEYQVVRFQSRVADKLAVTCLRDCFVNSNTTSTEQKIDKNAIFITIVKSTIDNSSITVPIDDLIEVDSPQPVNLLSTIVAEVTTETSPDVQPMDTS
jgi:hypothetical protein